MKLTLVVPPAEQASKSNQPPLGLMYISSVLEENGFEVSIIDCAVTGYNFERFAQAICKETPRIVGITATTYSRFEAIETAKLVKNNMADTIVVVGGPHFSFTADDTLKHIKEIDIIVRGEGEYTMLELCRSVRDNLDMEDILGISYRNNGEVIHNADRLSIKNLDTIPFPDRTKVPLREYNQTLPLTNIPCTTVLTTRGCPNRCMFCSTSAMWGRTSRLRSPKNIVDEIEYLLNEYDIGGIFFVDDTLNISKKRVLDLCQEIRERQLDFKWYSDIRVDNIDKDLLVEMKAAGCYGVAIGVESGSQKVLDRIAKRIDLDQVRMCAQSCKELGLLTKAFFTFSHPGESYEDLDMTIKLMDELRPYVDLFAGGVVAIYPGTYLEENARNLGILPRDFSWDSLFNSPENKKIGIPTNIPVYMENFTIDYLTKVVAGITARNVYRNPKFNVWRTFKKAVYQLSHVRSYIELKRYMLLGKSLFREMIRSKK